MHRKVVMNATGKTTLDLKTDRGILHAMDQGEGITAVVWDTHVKLNEVPLAYECDTLSLPIDGALLQRWKPHCTFLSMMPNR